MPFFFLFLNVNTFQFSFCWIEPEKSIELPDCKKTRVDVPDLVMVVGSHWVPVTKWRREEREWCTVISTSCLIRPPSSSLQLHTHWRKCQDWSPEFLRKVALSSAIIDLSQDLSSCLMFAITGQETWCSYNLNNEKILIIKLVSLTDEANGDRQICNLWLLLQVLAFSRFQCSFNASPPSSVCHLQNKIFQSPLLNIL